MHAKLEEFMGKFGNFIYENAIKIIIIFIILLAIPIYHLPDVKIDTSTEGFMHKSDPVLATYNKFKDQFGRDERIIISIKSDDIFTLEFLNILKNIHTELKKNVPHLNDITSLYNIRNTRGEGDKLITNDLLDPFPKTQAEVHDIKKRAISSHLYKDLFISEDGTMTTIVLESDVYSNQNEKEISIEDEFSDGFDEQIEDKNRVFLTDKENAELVKATMDIVRKYQKTGLEMYVAGSPLVMSSLKLQMQTDMQKFTKITFLIIAVFLFLMFRRISAVIYPLIVILFSLLATIGTMAWMGVALKLPTQIVPSLILAVSVGATVHILSIFFDRLNKHSDKKEAISYALKHSGLAIMMTSVTTAIGVGSFAGSEVAPISDLGIFASLGVMISLVLTITLLPALLSITKLKAKKIKKLGLLDRTMERISIIPIKYYKSIIAISFIFVFIALISSSKIELSHNPLFWFQENDYTRVSTVEIDKKMNGSVTIETIIDTGEENGWNNPQRLHKLNTLIEKIEKYTDEHTHVGKVISIVSIIKETNRALHENNSSFYTIPSDENLISQELLLFENSGSDDLEDVVDSQFSKIRISIKMPWTDAIQAVKPIAYIKQEAKKAFPNEKIETTGMIPLLVNTFSQSVNSSVVSYIIAFVLIAIMMMIILGSVRIGLLSMIPNLTPIILGLFLMYMAKIPLDMFTLLIGSIAIGLAVDDTIHFLHNFRRYYLEYGDSKRAIRETFITTGKAMLITTIVLSLGFYSYLMADMVSIQNFGLLTGSVIITALLADLLLAPALMMVVAKRGWIK